jgi:hypothetical protein
VPYFTGWFLDIEISKKVYMNMYPEGLPSKVITAGSFPGVKAAGV